MDNLHCVAAHDAAVAGAPAAAVAAVAVDGGTGARYVATVDGRVCRVDKDGTLAWTADTPDHPISLSYVIELDAVLVVSGPAGALTTLAAADGAPSDVGAVPGGLAAASPSPTGDAVALITPAGRLLLIGGADADWAPLAEADALAWCDAPVPARVMPPKQGATDVHITPADAHITWKGDGTALATSIRVGGGPSVLRVHAAPSGDLLALGEGGDPLAGPIAWQPNGRHVYAAAGVAAASEENPPPAARPATRALTPAAPDAAGRAAKPGRVALIEPNGMRHGDFGVAGPGERVAAVAWSPCSEVVAILVDAAAAATTSTIHLWRRCNWHWHAAYARTLPRGAAIAWDDGAPLRLHAAWAGDDTQPLTLSTLDFVLAPTTSPAGTAAVLDGRGVRLTPLARCALPPPLAAATVTTPTPGAAVAVGGTLDGGEAVAVLTVDGQLCLAACAAGGDDWQGCAAPLEARAVPLPGDWAGGGTPRALAWASPDSVLVVITPAAGADDGREEAVEVCVASGAVRCRARLPAPAAAAPAPHPGGAAAGPTLIHTADGGVAAWVSGDGLHPRPPLAQRCARVWSLGNAALGLTRAGDAYVNAALVARAVRSLGVRWGGAGGAAVVAVGGDDVLRVAPAAALPTGGLSPGPPPPPPPPDKDVPVGSWKADMRAAMRGHGLRTTRRGDPSARAVEAGAAIVAAPPNSSSVILSMPRGNLETVWPRALVLAGVGAALAARDWRGAAAAVATHRLDPNVIADYGWPTFPECAADYVAAVGDDAAVADFVRSLTPGSTLASRYAWLAAHDPAAGAGPPPDVDKVAAVASALRDALAAAPGGEAAWLRPIVAAHAALGDVPAALAAVRRVREAELAATGGAAPAPHPLTEKLGVGRRGGAPAATPADAGLRALLLSTPFDALYAAALGAYDLEVAHMVVLAAGRDPGEHLAELRAFAARPAGPLRRAAIDARLARWDRALDALVEAGPNHADEALALARERGLLRRLVAASEAGSPARAAALAAYASDLTARGRHEDAALARLSGDDVRGAVSSYAAAGAWRAALGLARGRAGFGEDELADLAAALADTLAASARYADAAVVAERYLGDVDRAVEWLAAGGEWRDALRVAADAGRPDLVDTTLAPAVADAAAAALEDARADAERARKYLARYKDVQARRAALDAMVDRGDGGGDDDDGASVATGVTGLSAYTTSSTVALTAAHSSSAASIAPSTVGGRGGHRKKKVPKPKTRHKVRAGSAGEEAALAATLAAAAPSDHRLACVGALTEALVMLGHEDDARALQAAVSDAVAAAAVAAEHVKNNPPAAVEGAAPASARPLKPAEWKWDLLRGVGGAGEE